MGVFETMQSGSILSFYPPCFHPIGLWGLKKLVLVKVLKTVPRYVAKAIFSLSFPPHSLYSNTYNLRKHVAPMMTFVISLNPHNILQNVLLCIVLLSPLEKKCKKAKRLSEEALQLAVKRREAKSKRERKDISIWMQSSKYIVSLICGI